MTRIHINGPWNLNSVLILSITWSNNYDSEKAAALDLNKIFVHSNNTCGRKEESD